MNTHLLRNGLRLLLSVSLCTGAWGCVASPSTDDDTSDDSEQQVGYEGDGKADNGSTTCTGAVCTESCDVVILGGTTAATAAAISAAREFQLQKLNRRVCLLEPTNWAGGQLTASGVSAVDFDHHSSKEYGANLSTLVANNAKVFADWMSQLAPAVGGAFTMDKNPGRCWVSNRCFEPKRMVQIIQGTLATYEQAGVLKVFYNTVPKQVVVEGKTVKAVVGIRRTPLNAEEAAGTYNRRLSSVIDDWYSESDSAIYSKKVIQFNGVGKYPVFIDATEWGEGLVLSGAAYDQGVPGDETCGQAIVYPLALELKASSVAAPTWFTNNVLPVVSEASKKLYSHKGGGGTWEKNWRYRRMKFAGTGSAWNTPPAAGDITQINVGDGNDYPFEYLFPAKAEAAQEAASGWKGGVKKSVLDHAEIHAMGYFDFMRKNDDGLGLGGRVAFSTAYGTANGLSKVPYMRDTRRSVGVGDFQMVYSDLLAGKRYDDTVGIGLYAADIHPVVGCSYPTISDPHPKPFYLPLRAHTNKSLDNLLVAGKTMAQDFVTNAATRLHPIEFNSGTAAGVAAVFMNRWELSSATMLKSSADVATRVRNNHAPIEWTRP